MIIFVLSQMTETSYGTLEKYENEEDFLKYSNTNNIRNLNKSDLRWKNRKVKDIDFNTGKNDEVVEIIIKLEKP